MDERLALVDDLDGCRALKPAVPRDEQAMFASWRFTYRWAVVQTEQGLAFALDTVVRGQLTATVAASEAGWMKVLCLWCTESDRDAGHNKLATECNSHKRAYICVIISVTHVL